jgi:4-amino-4-deoxy-L-arabinose transferase-like glycosyltransferase
MEKASLIVSIWRKTLLWIKKNQFEFLILVLVLCVGAFLRLYRISEYMTFLGDEGRDAIVVRRILVNGDLIFVGPGTSVGNMYLGPLYYYMMAPALWLANFSPAGPSVMIALLGVATIFFVWYVAKNWFGRWAAYFAAALYAISPTIIIFSRHSWNPNIMPFFALLTVFSLWKLWNDKNWKWLVVTGFSFGAVLQSHYLGLILIPIILVFWRLSLKGALKNKKGKKSAIKYTALSIVVFVLLMSPLLIFDAKYNWRNFKAMHAFFTERTSAVSGTPLDAISKVWPQILNASTRLLAAKNATAGLWVAALLSIGVIALIVDLIKKGLKTKRSRAYFLVITWFVIGIIGLSLYRNEIYDHYLGFMFPAPFILIGAFAQEIYERYQSLGRFLVVLGLAVLVIINLQNNPFKDTPNRQLQRTRQVANKIFEESNGEKFNFAVIADRNYEGAYQYFLESWNAPIVMIDPQRYDETLAEQLFVVCEYEDKTKCQPTSNPKAEVANFGWSRIDKQWEVGGIILFKLVHNTPSSI